MQTIRRLDSITGAFWFIGAGAAAILCVLAAAPAFAITPSHGNARDGGVALGAERAAAAAEADEQPGIQVHPLSSAPSIAPSPAPTSRDPRAAKLATALRAKKASLRGHRRAPARAVALSDAQREALSVLRDRVGNDVFSRFRPTAKTPRQIRGRFLEPAAAARARGSGSVETARAFLRTNRALLRLDDPNLELDLVRTQSDELGRTHLRFQQRYRGLEVWPAELIVHLDPQGNVDVMDGVYIATPRDLDTAPTLAAVAAIERARDRVPGARAIEIPDPSLFIYGPGDSPARLAFKVVVPLSLTSSWLVVVDATTGGILTAYDDVRTANVAGSGVDLFGVGQPLNVWFEGGTFYLVDTSKAMYDPSSDPPEPSTSRGTITIIDARNQPPTDDPQQFPEELFFITSSSATSGWLRDGVSAAFNFSGVYDYFYDVHGRDSLDDEGASILAVVRLGQNFRNAFFLQNNNLMAFGDAVPYAGALDVVAHELTHGVTFHTANLIYEDQPGALNEAFSDIFGEMVEEHVEGANDWLLGSKLPSPIRDMEDPSSLIISPLGIPYPEKFSDFIATALDNGGVHWNSSIINHAYYQLAAGLVGAIGVQDAAAIFFRALTLHLTANSQFIDARLACIQSAQELFPAGNQAQKTAEAFDFVEIFDAGGTPDPGPFPGTQGEDSTLFLFYGGTQCPDTGPHFCLGRREAALGDDPAGSFLTNSAVTAARPSVTGDGGFAVFVDSTNDMCFILTDPEPGANPEECLGFPGEIHSVAMSPDGNLYGFVFLDPFGEPDNLIRVFDLGVEPAEVREFELKAPAIDGLEVASIEFADAMDFAADGRLLFYDALNSVRLVSGAEISVWSIYAIDHTTGRTFTIVSPTLLLDIGFPALAQRSDNFVVFDAFDPFTGVSRIIAGNLNTGDVADVGTTRGLGVPSYKGDDSSILYSLNDSTATGFSLVEQPIAADRITPVGGRRAWLSDADLGVIYRRGTFVPEPGTPLLQLSALAMLALLAARRRAWAA